MNTNSKIALVNKILDTKLNYSGYGILTRREFIEKTKSEGAEAREVLRSKTKWNRIKYNRMDLEEQKKYEARMEIKVTTYNLVLPKGSFFEITKAEYEYFNSIK